MSERTGEERKTGRGHRRIFRLLLAAAVAAACLGAAARFRAELARENVLRAQLAGYEEQTEQLRQALTRNQIALDAARDTIARMEEYSLLAPDGTPPAYTQLYPELYAPAWDGERMEQEKTVCLTFDDGPSANTDQILDILDRYRVKATFFVVGRTGEADQQRLRDIVAAGHTLGVHSWSHDYRKIYASVEAYLEDFNQLYQWIREVTGVCPRVFRFPGGSINSYNAGIYQEIIAEMTRRGFVYFDWNVSAQDATVTPRPAADSAADCLKGVGYNLAVVLSHDSAARCTTVQALPAVIEGYRDAGYTFLPLNPGITPIIMGYRMSR